jgi:hypothetical protein
MNIKENKIDILEDLKRMIKSLNKKEKIKLFEFLKSYDKSYIILSNKEFDKIKSNINEAYINGFNDGEKKTKNQIIDENNKNINKTTENVDVQKIKNIFLKITECF